MTEADTVDKKVPCLKVEAIVAVSKHARLGNGRASNLCCATCGNDCEAKINARESMSSAMNC